MTDDQRPGQKLINYIRFIKDRHFYLGESEKPMSFPAPGERYLWNMNQKEFDEVMNSDWEVLAKKYGIPKKYRE
jgi:hypothetical protein